MAEILPGIEMELAVLMRAKAKDFMAREFFQLRQVQRELRLGIEPTDTAIGQPRIQLSVGLLGGALGQSGQLPPQRQHFLGRPFGRLEHHWEKNKPDATHGATWQNFGLKHRESY